MSLFKTTHNLVFVTPILLLPFYTSAQTMTPGMSWKARGLEAQDRLAEFNKSGIEKGSDDECNWRLETAYALHVKDPKKVHELEDNFERFILFIPFGKQKRGSKKNKLGNWIMGKYVYEEGKIIGFYLVNLPRGGWVVFNNPEIPNIMAIFDSKSGCTYLFDPYDPFLSAAVMTGPFPKKKHSKGR